LASSKPSSLIETIVFNLLYGYLGFIEAIIAD
jgi:hypothetical protein